MNFKTNIPSFTLKTLLGLGMLLFMMFAFSCKTKNPEQNRLDTLETSLKYKSYKTLSENTIPPVVLLYNSTSHTEDPDVSEGVLRLLLGYSWIVSRQPDFAIAESKIIDDLSTDDNDLKLLANSLSAMAMYDKGWKLYAQEEAEKGSSLLLKKPKDTATKLKVMTYHMILGTLCAYQENYQRARYHFINFSSVSKINWPYELVDALADLKDSCNIQQGLKKIKKLTLNKTLPDSLRLSLKKSMALAEKTTDKIDTRMFFPPLFSAALYEAIKKADIEGIGKVTELLNNLNRKLKIE